VGGARGERGNSNPEQDSVLMLPGETDGYSAAMAEGSGGGSRARPGAHPLRPEVIAHHQRQRILNGAAKAIAEQGYRQASVADIVKSAAIARARFYENFSSKQDCFFALYDAATAEALDLVGKACDEEKGEFPVKVRVGVEALLGYLESDRVLARACVVEGPSVGPPIGPRFEAMVGGFAELLRAGRRGADIDDVADTVEDSVIGGLYWLLYYALLDGDEEGLEQMVSQLTEFSLMPFIGAEAARLATG
jgi:AcrR family transcriptional regulator